MNKQEALKRIEVQKETLISLTGWAVYVYIEELIKSLDEPEKVKIPQFVAEIIEYYKKQNATLYDAIREKNFNKKYNDWLLNEQGAYDKVARAWLFGYEDEEEKRYYIRLKNVDENYNYLNYIKHLNAWCLAEIKTDKKFRTTHTRKELEEADFGEVFNSPLFEVVEVE